MCMRILIVEDESSLMESMVSYLEMEGFKCEQAADYHTAVCVLDKHHYICMLIDLNLPGGDGLDLVKLARENDKESGIIIISARNAIEQRVEGLEAGADDYLVKPFAMRELMARTRAMTRRSLDAPKSPVLRVADLELDTLTHYAKRGDKAIKLTTKEYAVLECLMREPERVLTRTLIAEHVWNYDVYNQSNVVDVYIRNLRRKIDDGHELKLIHTIRGAGYRISARDEDDTY